MEEEKEYLTGLKPLTLLSLISSLMTDIANKPSEEQKVFWESIYKQFTQILQDSWQQLGQELN